tara:strand:+ start:2247 stop:3464 length:1218 start_codon:yes stop_codon:yes gene_type:complete
MKHKIVKNYIIKNGIIIEVDGDMTQFTMPEGVTEIGESAFYRCHGLTQITIPEGVTKIGSYAFIRCSSLTQINMPDTVTEIGEGAFYECTNLTQINIPEGVTEIGKVAFCKCYGLTQINIPDGVTKIGRIALRGCISLNSINIPEGVTAIGEHAFRECFRLTQITIPEGVTEIGKSAFSRCHGLTQIAIPEGVTKISIFAFRECSSLTQINIPKGVTEICDYAFENCNQLRYIVVDSDSEIDRVKGLLPKSLRATVTSFYFQHVANIKAIKRAQFYFFSSKMSLFNGILTDFIAHKVYQFLSINEMQLLPRICKSLAPIRPLYYAINQVKFSYVIPITLDGSTVRTQFLNTPRHPQETLSKAAYKDRLKMFKKDIQDQSIPRRLANQPFQEASSSQPPNKKARHW